MKRLIMTLVAACTFWFLLWCLVYLKLLQMMKKSGCMAVSKSCICSTCLLEWWLGPMAEIMNSSRTALERHSSHGWPFSYSWSNLTQSSSLTWKRTRLSAWLWSSATWSTSLKIASTWSWSLHGNCLTRTYRSSLKSLHTTSLLNRLGLMTMRTMTMKKMRTRRRGTPATSRLTMKKCMVSKVWPSIYLNFWVL